MNRVPPARHRLRRAVERALQDLPGDAPVLVACSGGPDSLALAAAVADAVRPATAAVVDHGLQAGSGPVAAAAAEQCRALGLPATVIRVRVTAGDGPEAAARAARYDALDAEADRTGVAAVLLGHTRDDQAEAVLLGLARGSGTRSLAGMPAVRGRYRRPFLDTPRRVVEAALAEHGLLPWRDPHNTDPAFLRARVRGSVLPLLEEQLGPGVSDALARTAALARADADALDDWARREYRSAVPDDPDAARLAALPVALRSRILRRWLRERGCPAGDLTYEHVVEVDRLVTDWRGQGPLTLPGPVLVGRRYGRLYTVDATAAQGERT